MNPIDSSVESIKAGSVLRRLHLRSTLVKPFEVWLKAQDAFTITFERFCSDACRLIVPAVTA
jgi:hypothetical protein